MFSKFDGHDGRLKHMHAEINTAPMDPRYLDVHTQMLGKVKLRTHSMYIYSVIYKSPQKSYGRRATMIAHAHKQVSRGRRPRA